MINAVQRLFALRWIVAAALVVVFAMTTLGYFSLRDNLSDLSSTKRQGAIWEANQLEFELLRFSNSLAMFIAEDPDTTADNVRFRFDILWSRQAAPASDIRDSPEWSRAAEAEAVEQFGTLLREVDNMVVTLQDGDTETAKYLHTAFREFFLPLHEFTILVKEKQAEIDLEAREEIWRLSQFSAMFGSIIAFVSLLLAALFYIDARSHRRISSENIRLFEESQAAYKAKVEFLSTVSHELRTPLTSIKGVLGLFVGGALGPLSDKALEMSQIAYRSSSKLEALINDIMDSAKLERKGWNLKVKDFDLVQLAETAAESHQIYRIGRLIRIVNKAGGEIQMQADPIRIEQVISNLLSNAIKFSDDKTNVILTVDRTDTEALITVQDFGSGIPKSFKSRIFEEFTQADSSDTRSAGGTGLGLSIAKHIVEWHGGTISFESTEGLGTTFTITLPLRSSVSPLGETE